MIIIFNSFPQGSNHRNRMLQPYHPSPDGSTLLEVSTVHPRKEDLDLGIRETMRPHQKLLSTTCQEEQLIPALALEPKLARTKTQCDFPNYFGRRLVNHDLRWKRNAACCLNSANW